MRKLLFVMCLGGVAWSDQTLEGLTLPLTNGLSAQRPGFYQGYSFGPLDKTPETLNQLWTADSSMPVEQKLAAVAPHLAKLPMTGLHLRTTKVQLGPWPALVLDGTSRVQNNPNNMMLCTVAVATTDKLYIYTQLTQYPTVHKAFLCKLGGFRMGADGLTGYPTDFPGVYKMGSFSLRSPGYPSVLAVNQDSDYKSSYDAMVMGIPAGVSAFYYVRELKDDDRRSDAELFYALAKRSNLPAELKAVHFEKTEAIVNEETPEWKLRCQFRRQGRWVAVLVRRVWGASAMPTSEPELID